MTLSPYSKSMLCAATMIVTSSFASAQTYSYERENYTTSSSISVIDEFSVTYNQSSETLQLDVSYANDRPDGFWVVLSDGENPRANADEYAIFYFDATTDTPVVSAHVYDGTNTPSSFSTRPLLDSNFNNPASNLSGSVSQSANGGDAFSLTVNASAINAANLGPDWDGAQFGENIGVWFHTFTIDGSTAYNLNGGLSSLPIQQRNFLDVANGNTDLVPEPSSSLLLGLSGMLVLLRRKRA